MKLMRLFSILIVCCSSISAAQEPVEIPLDEVWGYHLPGTTSVWELEPEMLYLDDTDPDYGVLIRNSDVYRIKTALDRLDRFKVVPPGFAVQGTGRDALDRVLARLLGDREQLLREGEVSVFFYSGLVGTYVRLDGVKRDGNTITINYHLIVKSTLDATTHYALIPLGELEEGSYKVEMRQGPTEDRSIDRVKRKVDRRFIVCQDFEFQVEE